MSNFKQIMRVIEIIGYLAVPFLLINELRSIASAEDKNTASLRQVKYILLINKFGKRYEYTLTSEDIMNLLRAVYKEGNQEIAVTYSLLSRFALLYPHTYNSFSLFLKDYAQPINPRWFPTGDKFKQYYARTSYPEIALKKAEERVTNSKLTIQQIPQNEQDIVFGILSGEIKNPVPGSVHYITSQANSDDDEMTARKKQQLFTNNRADLYQPLYYESSKKGNNWFFNVKNTSNPNVFGFTIKKQVIV